MAAVMAALDTGDADLVRARVEFRLACIHASETACRIVESVATMAGTAALLESGTLSAAGRCCCNQPLHCPNDWGCE